MNNPHQNARLTLHSREQIVARISAGQTAPEVAAAFAVDSARVCRYATGHDAPDPADRPSPTPPHPRLTSVIPWPGHIPHIVDTSPPIGHPLAFPFGVSRDDPDRPADL